MARETETGTSSAVAPVRAEQVAGSPPLKKGLTWDVAFPAITALLGACVGAVVAVVIASQQIAATDKVTLRERQVETYAELLVSAKEYRGAIMVAHESASNPPASVDNDQLDLARAAFSQDLAIFQLLGADQAQAQASALESRLFDLRELALDPDSVPTYGLDTAPVDQAIYDLIDAARSEVIRN